MLVPTSEQLKVVVLDLTKNNERERRDKELNLTIM